MSSYLISPEGTFAIDASDGAADVVCVLTEQFATPCSQPLQVLTRQQVATSLGRGLPTDFPQEDIMIGDPNQGGTRGWFHSTVQRYLARGATASDGPTPAERKPQSPDQSPDGASAVDANAWERGSRRWADVDFTGADERVLLLTSRGVLTPAGKVLSPPMTSPQRLGQIVCKRQWSTPGGGAKPQLWVFPEALDSIGFPIDDLREDELPAVVADFFSCEVTYHQSGWFGCAFDSAIHGGESRSADIILMPYLALDPSKARPTDWGLAGIHGTDSELPDDEEAAAHLLGDRIAWLYGQDGILGAPRWTGVGAQLLVAKTRTARPKAKNSAGPAPDLMACPLPQEISTSGRLTNQWWIVEGVEAAGTPEDGQARRPGVKVKRTPHRSRTNTIDVELDQQAAYLPAAEGLYLGYGQPQWIDPNPAVFNESTPPFGIWKLTTPAGADLDLLRKLPLPHPAMTWDAPATFWATTADVRHLTAAVEIGGAGIAWAELQLESAYVWPEQHQWLKQWARALRGKRTEAVSAGRADYEQMIKAIYTATLGRMDALGDTAWKHPYTKFTQPAWYASIEAMTRARAMKYAARIGRDFDLWPIGWWADAWFYRVPDTFNPHQLEDPLREDGLRTNGSYRVKNIDRPPT